MTIPYSKKENHPTSLTDIKKVEHFLYYIELVIKLYIEEDFIGLSENSTSAMKNVEKMAKKAKIHPNLTRDLILLHEEASVIDPESVEVCPECEDLINSIVPSLN